MLQGYVTSIIYIITMSSLLYCDEVLSPPANNMNSYQRAVQQVRDQALWEFDKFEGKPEVLRKWVRASERSRRQSTRAACIPLAVLLQYFIRHIPHTVTRFGAYSAAPGVISSV